MYYLRKRFSEQFADCTGRTYIGSNVSGDTGAFSKVSYSDNIGAEDVKLFLLKQTYKSFLFLSETMDIFVWLAESRHGSSRPSSQLIWLKA